MAEEFLVLWSRTHYLEEVVWRRFSLEKGAACFWERGIFCLFSPVLFYLIGFGVCFYLINGEEM